MNLTDHNEKTLTEYGEYLTEIVGVDADQVMVGDPTGAREWNYEVLAAMMVADFRMAFGDDILTDEYMSAEPHWQHRFPEGAEFCARCGAHKERADQLSCRT